MDRLVTRKNKDRLDKTIGENIRNERKARSMSRDELAEALDLTVSHMGLIERGERGATALTLEKLSLTFDISIDSLFREAKKADSERTHAKEQDYELERNIEKITNMITKLNRRETDFIIQTIKGLLSLQPQDPIDDFDNLDFE